MNEYFDYSKRVRAGLAVFLGVVWYIATDLIEDPDSTALDIILNLLEVIPLVLTTVGTVILFQITQQQRDEHARLIRGLELERIQGLRWRNEVRTHLNGLGEAINEQFSLWSLTEAEREVALLLLKGLSIKEVATVRDSSERTVREQARSIYSKAGLIGRASLSAFFLEDLLAPIQGLDDE